VREFAWESLCEERLSGAQSERKKKLHRNDKCYHRAQLRRRRVVTLAQENSSRPGTPRLHVERNQTPKPTVNPEPFFPSSNHRRQGWRCSSQTHGCDTIKPRPRAATLLAAKGDPTRGHYLGFLSDQSTLICPLNRPCLFHLHPVAPHAVSESLNRRKDSLNTRNTNACVLSAIIARPLVTGIAVVLGR
jgi:hypothetical protein